MKDRIIFYGSLICGFVVIVVCVTVLFHMSTLSDVRVTFLDVGQGDAILISQGTNQILIDGGPDGTILLEELGAYMPFWDRTIEIVVATHPDGDHIDGLISVFENYRVKQLWHTDAQKDTATYKTMMHHAKKEDHIELIEAYNGLSAKLKNASLNVVYPYNNHVSTEVDVNDTSIVTIFTYGDDTFYFGGDATSAIEDNLPVENITALKASHHGSKSSTSEQFLQRMRPRDVVFSSGVNNRYGHPHDDVLERVLRSGAQIFRTDQMGSIAYVCGGVDNACKILYE